MGDIHVSIRECLRQLNQNMVLEGVDGERHKARTWHRYIPNEILRHWGEIESNIYNEGRIKIQARIETSRHSAYYFILHQTPLTEFVRRNF